jgi:CubicO group peptidase (beta-lactamase class C family)
MYGASIEWTAALVIRLTNQDLEAYTQAHIFKPLAMTSSTYRPQAHPDMTARLLHMVMRQDGQLIPVEYEVREMLSSVPDLTRLFADLLSPSSVILSREHQDLLFAPQFAASSAARAAIRCDTENYAAPTGIPPTVAEAPVNHSLAALVIEEQLPLSVMPAGTVTWNGMPNTIWAMHREKGVAMMFVTQLVPVDDPKTVDIAMDFFRGAWKTFG